MQGITGTKNKGLKRVLIFDHHQSEGRLMRHLIKTESKNLEKTARRAQLNATNMVETLQHDRATMWPESAEWNRGKKSGSLINKAFKKSCKNLCSLLEKLLGGSYPMETLLVTVWWKEAVGPAFRAARTQAKMKSPNFSRPTSTKTTIFQIQSSELDLCSVQDLTLFCWSSFLCCITGLLSHEVLFRGDIDISEITEG